VVEVTDRQLAVIRAHVATGTTKGAAAALGISYSTASGHLARARERLDVGTTEQVVYLLTATGKLVVPSLGEDAA